MPPTCDAVVDGLYSGRHYVFRVSVRNHAGLASSFSETADAALPFGAPAAPQYLRSADVGTDYALLQWGPPHDDGGRPVREFALEMRKADPAAAEPCGSWIVADTKAGVSDGTHHALVAGRAPRFFFLQHLGARRRRTPRTAWPISRVR